MAHSDTTMQAILASEKSVSVAGTKAVNLLIILEYLLDSDTIEEMYSDGGFNANQQAEITGDLRGIISDLRNYNLPTLANANKG